MRYAALIVPLVALLALACKGGGGPASTPTAAPASPTPTATATPAAAVPSDVQAIIDAALSGDPEELLALVQYTTSPCTAMSEGIGGPPTCRQGEADGTPVDVLSVGTCEGAYLRPEEVGDTLALLTNLSLFAVYRWPQGSGPAAEYAVLFSATAPAGDEIGDELLVQGGRVVHVKFGCGETPAQLVQFQGLEDVVLPPQP